MSSPYYSLVPRSQKPYATPWHQVTFVDNPISIETELENAITQIISENEISKVPSADAIYKYLFNNLKNLVYSSSSNVFTGINTFNKSIISPETLDFTDQESLNLLPNVGSIKEYVQNLISGEIPDLTEYINSLINASLSNSYTYVATNAAISHLITHNLNASYIIYNIFIFDETTGNYRNDVASVIEIDSNNILIELKTPEIIKVIITRIVSEVGNNYTYTSTFPNTSHMLSHNLNSNFVYFNIMVYVEELQLYRNDIVSITEINNDSLLVETSIPVHIKAAVSVF